MSKTQVDTRKWHAMTDLVQQGELAKLHTEQLIKVRDAAYKHAHCECCGTEHGVDALYNASQTKLLTNVKAILVTRPHVPSKAERKAARQAAAKKGK